MGGKAQMRAEKKMPQSLLNFKARAPKLFGTIAATVTVFFFYDTLEEAAFTSVHKCHRIYKTFTSLHYSHTSYIVINMAKWQANFDKPASFLYC